MGPSHVDEEVDVYVDDDDHGDGTTVASFATLLWVVCDKLFIRQMFVSFF